ncbi:MAG: hypothetical protein R3C01_13230 [Planctomycetaceae bacterium]
MSTIRTFRAPTVREALALVRDALGPDALILSNREVPVRRMAGDQRRSFLPATFCELTAQRHEADPFGDMASLDQPVALSDPRTTLVASLESASPTTAVTQHTATKDYDIFSLYTALIDVDVEEEDARELLHELTFDAAHHQCSHLAELQSRIAQQVQCAGPILVAAGTQRIVALVGPTGVGKTTTLAKLAANFHLRDGIKVGLITIDTFRIGAVEQLQTYANLIELPMQVVSSPEEMQQAIGNFAGLDLILIDTTGRSPSDELKIQETRALLDAAHVDEVHLVMSLTVSPRTAAIAAERYRLLGTTALLLTKFDEVSGPGSVLSVARQIQLPISYLTNGQEVPDDIEVAETSRIVQWLSPHSSPPRTTRNPFQSHPPPEHTALVMNTMSPLPN